VEVDILAHRYPPIFEPKNEEGITMLSLPDILAMKLNATKNYLKTKNIHQEK